MAEQLRASSSIGTPAATRSLEVILLCFNYQHIAATVRESIRALTGLSHHNVRILDFLEEVPEALDFERFDVIMIHYSLEMTNFEYFGIRTQNRVARSRALKVAFIQDEYRHVDATVDAIERLGLDILFTCVPEAEVAKVYPPSRLPRLRTVNVLTGYVEPELLQRPVPPYAARPVDVAYRARKVPYWLGELGREKWCIAEHFLDDAPHYALKVDISYREEDRIYGERWIRFVSNCKAMLGVESGASVFDFTGNIQAAVDQELWENPHLDFDTLSDRYFRHLEGQVRLNQISPRCFEAAALRTLLILYDGEYSGILVPWRHYVPLRKDHSNMDEVVAVLRDEARAQAIIDTAYREVACNPLFSFAAMVRTVDAALAEEAEKRKIPAATPYADAEFKRLARPARGAQMRHRYRQIRIQLPYWVLRYGFFWLGRRKREHVLWRMRRIRRRLQPFLSWSKRQILRVLMLGKKPRRAGKAGNS